MLDNKARVMVAKIHMEALGCIGLPTNLSPHGLQHPAPFAFPDIAVSATFEKVSTRQTRRVYPSLDIGCELIKMHSAFKPNRILVNKPTAVRVVIPHQVVM